MELEGDGGDFRIVFPRALLDQISREQEARTQDVNRKTPTVSALGQINPVETSNAIDFAPTLLRMLHGAKVVSDAPSVPGTVAGVVLRLADRVEKEDPVSEDLREPLTLWLGADLVSVGAATPQRQFSFLIFKGVEAEEELVLCPGRRRLVRVRHESTESGSGGGRNRASRRGDVKVTRGQFPNP